MNLLDHCLPTLVEHARRADEDAVWPEASWNALAAAGVLRWSIPREYGGGGADTIPLLETYERLASACLTTCFLLSQREAAVRRIVDLGSDFLHGELLPPLAQGSRFATVGLSQLTTSRQHGAPALVARSIGDDFILDGTTPWVTGAARADHFILGAATEDNRQVLLVVRADSPGLSVGESLDLSALAGSLTAEIQLRNVRVPRRWLLAGPAEKVLTSRRGGAGGLETSCLAVGLAGAAIAYLQKEGDVRADLRPIADSLAAERDRVRGEMHALARNGGDAAAAVALRGRANALVLRASQAALITAKGAGFLRDHPAQRWARQALFFLVWSCPRPAAQAALAQLATAPD